MGQKIGSDLVTVKDDPSLMKNGYYPFDDEGSQAQETILVKKGVLNAYLLSRETAGMLGGVPRNARSMGLDRPIVRMSNTYIPNGDFKSEEIFEELGDGIYLMGSRGGQVNTAEGVFQFNARRVHREEGREDQAPEGCFSFGKILEILHDIKAVGVDESDVQQRSLRQGRAAGACV